MGLTYLKIYKLKCSKKRGQKKNKVCRKIFAVGICSIEFYKSPNKIPNIQASAPIYL